MNEAQVVSVWTFRMGDWLLRLKTSLSIHESIPQKYSAFLLLILSVFKCLSLEADTLWFCAVISCKDHHQSYKKMCLSFSNSCGRDRGLSPQIQSMSTPALVFYTAPARQAFVHLEMAVQSVNRRGLECEFILCEMTGRVRRNEQLYRVQKSRRKVNEKQEDRE